jgi:hypothetical protein
MTGECNKYISITGVDFKNYAQKTNVYSVNTYTYLPRITQESSKAYFQWGPV